jgi:hypothetical protein
MTIIRAVRIAVTPLSSRRRAPRSNRNDRRWRIRPLTTFAISFGFNRSAGIALSAAFDRRLDPALRDIGVLLTNQRVGYFGLLNDGQPDMILAEQADRSFQSVDLVISSVAAGVAAEGVTDSASFDRIMASRDVHLLLRAKMSGTPQLDAINVISRTGQVINFSRDWPVPEIDVSDRDYYKAMTADPNVKTYVSQPVQNRATGAWTIFLVHRVDGVNGELLGFVNGAVALKYFEEYYQAITLRQGSSVAILRLDGVTLTRFPRTDTIGKAYSDAQHLLHGGISAVLRQVSPVDGEVRIVAARRLSDYPLILLVSVTEEAALANWRSIAWLMSFGALGFAIAIAVATFAFGRQWKQQAELGRQEERSAAMGMAVGVAQATALEMTHAAEHDALTGCPIACC